MKKPPEVQANDLHYYVVGGARGTNDGDPPLSYSVLEDALAAAGDQPLEADRPVSLEIVCDRPNSRPQPYRKSHYRFCVDPSGGVAGGDGSELAPFTSFEVAARGIGALHRDGNLTLRQGQRIRVDQRVIFTATHHETRKKIKEDVAKSVLMLMAMSLVVPVVAILGYLVFKAWPALGPEFIFQNPKVGMPAGGIWAPLVGTFFLVVISLLAAAPIGVLAGVYLNEYAKDNWLTRIISLAVVNLAGVPSIVHALFGVGAFVMFAGMGKSVLAASCTLAVMTLPVIITSTREALASVPMSFREACWNMGATRWQTIRTIVLPNSISGVLTGVILQVSRAAGETAPILFTGAVFFVLRAPVAKIDVVGDARAPHQQLGLAANDNELDLVREEHLSDLFERALLCIVDHTPSTLARRAVLGRPV